MSLSPVDVSRAQEPLWYTWAVKEGVAARGVAMVWGDGEQAAQGIKVDAPDLGAIGKALRARSAG